MMDLNVKSYDHYISQIYENPFEYHYNYNTYTFGEGAGLVTNLFLIIYIVALLCCYKLLTEVSFSIINIRLPLFISAILSYFLLIYNLSIDYNP